MLESIALLPPTQPPPPPDGRPEETKRNAPYSSTSTEQETESPYTITVEDQRRDPAIARILQTLQTAKQGKNPNWTLLDGKVCRLAFSTTNEPLTQVYVPYHR